jgi:hypothetical protein
MHIMPSALAAFLRSSVGIISASAPTVQYRFGNVRGVGASFFKRCEGGNSRSPLCLVRPGASIDTTTPSGKLVFGIFASLAEFERFEQWRNRMAKVIVRTDEAPQPLAGYSQAIKSKGLVFVAGQTRCESGPRCAGRARNDEGITLPNLHPQAPSKNSSAGAWRFHGWIRWPAVFVPSGLPQDASAFNVVLQALPIIGQYAYFACMTTDPTTSNRGKRRKCRPNSAPSAN